jgi:hypothetical protein
MLRNLFVIAGSVFMFSSVSHGLDMCYERTYDAAHMQAHKGQTLKGIKVKIADSNVFVSGVSAEDGKEYQFVAGDRVGKHIMCASFSADGDDYSGCLKIVPNPAGAMIIPLELKYKSADLDMESKGIELLRCEGTQTDGEGCISGLKKVLVSPANPEDAGYLLNKTDCN